jgi:LmbE family N-acetylglucosaminyl deacetylase
MMNALNALSRFSRHRHRDAFSDTPQNTQDRQVLAITASAATWSDVAAFSPAPAESETIRALLVNAHPDDESESAGSIYRITHELGGTVDQVVVTNGEAGHRYATLGEAFYRLPLTSASARRELLGPIRREELMRASRILGIRHSYFFNQTDTGVTLSATDAFEAWDIERVRHELRALLEFGHYNLLLVLLPAADTHGHHKTVAVLTLEAIAGLEAEHQPAVLGVRTAPSNTGELVGFSELMGYPLTKTTTQEPLWSFDRRAPLACHPSLNYGIVANWVVAEHKSQGLLQLENGRRTHEHFWLFDAGGKPGAGRSLDFVQAMERNSVAQDCVPQ